MSTVSRLAGVHPQTIRGYERRGLVWSARTGGNIRLYSAEDIARLIRIRRLASGHGLNLAAVSQVIAIEEALRVLLLSLIALASEVEKVDGELFEDLRDLGREVWESLPGSASAVDMNELTRRAIELTDGHPHASSGGARVLEG